MSLTNRFYLPGWWSVDFGHSLTLLLCCLCCCSFFYCVWSFWVVFYPLANEVAKGYSNASVRPSHPCEHSRINILQWILTKLGTYLVLMRIWNPIDFLGHQVKFLPHNILVNTLESTFFNGFWLNLVHT